MLSGGVLAVHELRYRAGYGEHADAALTNHGHAYLVGVMAAYTTLARWLPAQAREA
jgi:hypothetical protein